MAQALKLKNYQKAGARNVLKDFKEGRDACLGWYTGAGKTVVFQEISKRLIKENPKIRIGISAYFTKEIRDQIYDRMGLMGLEKKAQLLHKDATPDKNKNIFVFNPQAIYRKTLPFKFDVLIIDECHYGFSESNLMLNVLKAKSCKRGARTLLLSATPWDTLARTLLRKTSLYKRSLEEGLKDDLISDFEICVEEAQIEFDKKSFTRKGDLSLAAQRKQMSRLKSSCVGKMENIVKKYGDKLGKKVLVVCPPGNTGEVAREIAEKFGGLALLESTKMTAFDTKNNLEKFQQEKDARFLCVVQKCQVGFDMKELDTVIDLTMTRNIQVLAQRIGRVARKNGRKKKRFIYVIDKSLGFYVDWVLNTLIEFSLGEYDGWNTQTVKYRPTPKTDYFYRRRDKVSGVLFSTIVKDLKRLKGVKTTQTIKLVSKAKPKLFRSLDDAIKEAEKYKDRTTMWRENPALYKWFRLYAKAEMDKIFPLKNKAYITEELVIATMKKCKTRKEFNTTYKSQSSWVTVNNKGYLRDKYLPAPLNAQNMPPWNYEKAGVFIKNNITDWRQMRRKGKASSLRRWLAATGLTAKAKKEFYLPKR